MPRKSSIHPTELELQILHVLWKNGPLAVREVREGLAREEGRDLAHTSVITVLNTMVRKKFLRRRARANAYIFEAAAAKETVSAGILKDVVDRVFEGSAASMMLHLLENEKVSKSEHEALKAIINQQRSKKGKAAQ